MRVVVIGGTGHIGSYLVPRLVAGGHDVVCVSRGIHRPYFDHPSWALVESVSIDRVTEEASLTFGSRVVALHPDAVIDLTCFDAQSAEQLVTALRSRPGTYLLHCGTVWVHGTAIEVPVVEEDVRHAFGDYGTAKAAAEELLLAESGRAGTDITILHPGHIVGPGWVPIGPTGNRDLSVFEALANGAPITMANQGLETLHHVHADDVAQAFELALVRRPTVAGQTFHVAASRALTMRGFAQAVAAWFDQEPDIRFVPLAAFPDLQSEHARTTSNHVLHSTNVSIEKTRRLLGYAPRFTALEAIAESIAWLADHGQLSLGGRRPPAS